MTDRSRLDQIAQLARQPVEPDPGAVARVSAAVRRWQRGAPHPMLVPRVSYALMLTGVLLAFAAGLLVRGSSTPQPAVSAAGLTPVTFVLVAENARDVTVVGDFNDWTPGTTRLRRQAGGVWSVVVPMQPGRYSYAFIVDGSTWLPDPAAPRNAEEDFGQPSSIVLVERGAS